MVLKIGELGVNMARQDNGERGQVRLLSGQLVTKLGTRNWVVTLNCERSLVCSTENQPNEDTDTQPSFGLQWKKTTSISALFRPISVRLFLLKASHYLYISVLCHGIIIIFTLAYLVRCFQPSKNDLKIFFSFQLHLLSSP